MTALAIALLALVTVARFLFEGDEVAVTALYMFPIAILAIEYEIRGGVLAGLAATAAFALWMMEERLSWALLPLRVIAFVGMGLLIGWIARCHRRDTLITHSVLEAFPGPVSVKDTSGRYLLTNSTLQQMMAQSGEALAGTTGAPGQGAEAEERVAQADRIVVETKEPVEFDVTVHPPHENFGSARVIKSPVFDDQGRLIAIFTFAHDISSTVQHERRLMVSVEGACREYERARNDYARLMRHRLANPLTIIEGAAQTLHTPFAETKEGREQLADLICEQVHRLAKLDVGSVEPAPEEGELDAHAHADLEEIRTTASEFSRAIRWVRRTADSHEVPEDDREARVDDRGARSDEREAVDKDNPKPMAERHHRRFEAREERGEERQERGEEREQRDDDREQRDEKEASSTDLAHIGRPKP